MLAQQLSPAADQVPGRLGAGDQQELAVREQVALGQRLAVQLAGHQVADHVVGRLPAALREQLAEEGHQVADVPG